MKQIRNMACCMLAVSLLTVSCGDASLVENIDMQNTVAENDAASSEISPEEPAFVLHGDFITQPGNVVKTWEKDYDSSQWADSALLTVYVSFVGNEADLILIEEEANHYLYEQGYDFQLHFIMPTPEEFIQEDARSDAERRNRADGVTVDLYMTYDYRTAMENEEVLELTDYLQSAEGEALYQCFDETVWQQLRDEEGRIYGVPNNPIAVSRLVYGYAPQMAELLGVDMQNFGGDLAELEAVFPRMLEQGVMPIMPAPTDFLLLSNFGLEAYGEIFAIRHEGDSWQAENLFEDDQLTGFYEQLGAWREAGYVAYSSGLLRELGISQEDIEKEMALHSYNYVFLALLDRGESSFSFRIEAPDGSVTGAYYVPPVQAYVTEDVNSLIWVINADTEEPEACMELVRLLKTDDTLKSLLYSGIENYHYMWQDGRIIYETAGFAVGLGYDYDRSFMGEASRERFAKEFHDMNQGVTYALSYEKPCDFSDTDLESSYQVCRQIFEENWLVFLGYYGLETGARLEEVERQLEEAGYLELIESINAGR